MVSSSPFRPFQTVSWTTWNPLPSRTFDEYGDTGTAIFGGVLRQTDYNAEWNVPTRYTIIEQMRNDPTVATALRALKLPLLRASYFVVPPSDNPLQRQMAEYIEWNLMEGMSHPFLDVLRHSLQMLEYGSYPHEKVWDFDQRPSRRAIPHIRARKISPRHPASVSEWHVDPHGGLKGIRQRLSSDMGAMELDIDVEKLLVFVHEQEGADFRGRSILRAAYKPWWYKQGMESVDAVAKEKRASGIDVMALEDSASTDDKNAAEAALQTIRSHQRNFLTYPKSRMEYDIKGIGAGSVLSTMETMEYHDLRILRSMMVEFAAMGAGSTGSLAMHRDKTQLALLLVEAIIEQVLETFNRHFIPQLCQFNWDRAYEFPKLKHSRLDVRDVAPLADAINKLQQSGMLHPLEDGSDENVLREIIELPPRNEPADVSPTPTDRPVRDGEEITGDVEDAAMSIFTRQIDSLRALAKRKTTLEEVLSLGVPFKKEMAERLRKGNDPEDFIKAVEKSDHYASLARRQIVREWSVTNAG